MISDCGLRLLIVHPSLDIYARAVISMSSVPTTSHLSESPTPTPGGHRVHRHRRSAAISGEFDVIGLGLFSPPPPISKTSRHSAVLSGSLNMTQHRSSHQRLFLSSFVSHPQPSNAIEYPDSRFQFSNDDDFFNRPEQDAFHFPVKSSDITLLSLPCTPRYLASPRKHDSTLNSPVRFKNNKNASSANCPLTPKLFLTEETTLNSENIPDAVIDLDKILNTNTNTNTNRHTSDNPEPDLEFGFRDHYDFLASPFVRLGLSLFSSSAYGSPSYLKQPVRDQTADAIVEEDDLDDFRLAEEDMHEEQSEGTAVLDENDIVPSEVGSDIFANPQNTFHSLYLTNSENSSNSSLPSTGGGQKLPLASNIGRTPSNSSKDSAMSTFFSFSGTPVSKRSSAKATRYQSFYDQSHKISSALKYSSTESIPLIASCGIENTKSVTTGASGNEYRTKGDKPLGHSSSLPSLKSNVKRPVPTTYNDFRVKRDIKNAKAGSQISKSAIVLEHLSKFPNTANLPVSSVPLLSSKHQSRPVDLYAALGKQKKSIQTPVSKVSNSPSSLLSEYSSTVTSAGDASTDRSSVMSQGEAHVSNLKTSASEHSRCSTPIIVVSMEPDNFSSSNSASQEGVALESSIEGSPERSAVTTSYRRPMSPSEKKILSSTVIPLFGKLGKQNSEKKASEVDFVCSETEHVTATIGTRSDEPVCATADRTISLRKHTGRKSDRFSSWFKRHK